MTEKTTAMTKLKTTEWLLMSYTTKLNNKLKINIENIEKKYTWLYLYCAILPDQWKLLGLNWLGNS
jgi:hypothetical protein